MDQIINHVWFLSGFYVALLTIFVRINLQLRMVINKHSGMQYLLLVILVLCQLPSLAGSQDSLKNALSTTGRNESRVDLLNTLSYSLWNSSPDSMFLLARQAQRLSQKLEYLKGEGTSYNNMAIYYWLKDLPDSAMAAASRCFVISKKMGDQQMEVKALNSMILATKNSDPDTAVVLGKRIVALAYILNDSLSAGRILTNIGGIFHQRGWYDSAQYYYTKALTVQSAINDNERMGSTLSNLANISKRRGDYVQALAYYQQTLSLLPDKDLQGRLYTLLGIAGLYYEMEDFEQSKQYCSRGLNLAFKLNLKGSIYRCYEILGMISLKEANYNEALALFHKGLAIQNTIDNPCEKLLALTHISEGYLKKGSLDSALYYINQSDKLSQCQNERNNAMAILGKGIINLRLSNLKVSEPYLLRAMEIANEQGLVELMRDANYSLYSLYKQKSNPTKALEHYISFRQYEDSLNSTNMIRAFATKEAEYKAGKENELLKLEQEKQRLLYESTIKDERIRRNYLLAGCIVLLIFGANYYYYYKKKKKSLLLLEEQNKEITKLNNSLNSLNVFKDGLTHMIAHDMKNALDAVINLSHGEGSTRKMKSIYRSGYIALNLVKNMLDVQKFEEVDIRLIKKQYHLVDLIVETLQEVEFLLEMKNIRVSYHCNQNAMVNVDKNVIKRVILNLLTNAVKYSEVGSEIKISVFWQSEQSKKLSIAVSDSGQGISIEHIPFVFEKYWHDEQPVNSNYVSTGLGLAYCKLAVEAHEGTIQVSSYPGQGSTFTITIPDSECLDGDTISEGQKPELKFDYNGFKNEEKLIVQTVINELRILKVYQVSRLEKVLNKLDEMSINLFWSQKLRSIIYHGDKKRYNEMVAELGWYCDKMDNKI